MESIDFWTTCLNLAISSEDTLCITGIVIIIARSYRRGLCQSENEGRYHRDGKWTTVMWVADMAAYPHVGLSLSYC